MHELAVHTRAKCMMSACVMHDNDRILHDCVMYRKEVTNYFLLHHHFC